LPGRELKTLESRSGRINGDLCYNCKKGQSEAKKLGGADGLFIFRFHPSAFILGIVAGIEKPYAAQKVVQSGQREKEEENKDEAR